MKDCEYMKIRFLRTISVDVEKTKLEEVWDRTFNKWDELVVEDIFPGTGNIGTTIKTQEGDFLVGVPNDSFERVTEQKREFSF